MRTQCTTVAGFLHMYKPCLSYLPFCDGYDSMYTSSWTPEDALCTISLQSLCLSWYLFPCRLHGSNPSCHFDDPLHLSVPYNYQASRLRELPDNTFTRAIDMSHLRPTLLSLCQRDILVHVVLGRRAVLEPSTILALLMMMTSSQVDVPPPW